MKYTTLKKEYSISCKDYVKLVIIAETGFYQVLCDNSQSGLIDIPISIPSNNLDMQNEIFYSAFNKI